MASGISVEAPDIAPLPGGLLSVANILTADGGRVGMGVSFDGSGLCAPVQIAPETCWSTFDEVLGVDGKVFDGLAGGESVVFGVYKGIECWLNGSDDYSTLAQRGLELGESVGVERAFQAAVLDDDPDDVLTGAVGPVTALAALEAWAATQFGSRATLHVGRFGAVWLASKGLISANLDGTLSTIQGTLVANGAGYNYTDASTGTFDTWDMWITPQVNLWPGTVVTSLGQARTFNTQRALAERPWAAALACPVVGKITVTTLTERLPEAP